MAHIYQDVFFRKNDKIELSNYQQEDDENSQHYLCINIGGVHAYFDDLNHLEKFTKELMNIHLEILAPKDEEKDVVLVGVKPQ